MATVRHVLVVDNELAIARIVSRVLGDDYEVRSCPNADEAYSLIRDGASFDVILCDILMPGLTGPGFYRKLARVVPDQALRVVFITGSGCLNETREFIDALPNVTLHKPFSREALREAVRGVGGTRPPSLAVGTIRS